MEVAGRRSVRQARTDEAGWIGDRGTAAPGCRGATRPPSPSSVSRKSRRACTAINRKLPVPSRANSIVAGPTSSIASRSHRSISTIRQRPNTLGIATPGTYFAAARATRCRRSGQVRSVARAHHWDATPAPRSDRSEYQDLQRRTTTAGSASRRQNRRSALAILSVTSEAVLASATQSCLGGRRHAGSRTSVFMRRAKGRDSFAGRRARSAPRVPYCHCEVGQAGVLHRRFRLLVRPRVTDPPIHIPSRNRAPA